MPHVARITIHPVKGLGGSEVDAARVTESGALEDDRRWRLVDAEGAVIEPSRWPILKHVHAEFLLASREVFLAIGRHAGVAAPVAGRFTLSPGPDGPGAWLSDCLGTHVSLQERPEGGFPDDPDAPGPTIAAAASLGEVARWFGLPLDDVRRRCPVGIEIGDCDPFWEDTLASPARPGSLAPLGALAGLPADP